MANVKPAGTHVRWSCFSNQQVDECRFTYLKASGKDNNISDLSHENDRRICNVCRLHTSTIGSI